MTDRLDDSRPTRVALRIADGPGPAYLAAAAEAVVAIAGAEVVLILVGRPSRARRSMRSRLAERVEGVYERVERLAFRGGARALALRPAAQMPHGVLSIVAGPQVAQAEALAASRADVLVDLLPGDHDGAALPIPPGGRWTLRFASDLDGPRLPRIGRPRASQGLGESVLSIELASGRLFESQAGVSALRTAGFSRDRDAIYWRSVSLPARRLARLVAGELVPSAAIDTLVTESVGAARAMTKATTGRPPFANLVKAVIVKAAERVVFRSGWAVFVRQRERDQDPPSDLSGFQRVVAPAGRFYADPFVVATPDGPRLYVEDCPLDVHRGRISTLSMGADGRWTLERVVLEDAEHRAYPHVLRVENKLVITPDSGRSGGVDLFVDHDHDEGPERLAHALIGLPASDPTLLWHDGRYWLFVAVTGHGMSPWDELHLFSAARLTDPWDAHPSNPVVADVRCARPAGRVFRQRGRLIRPGQDCSVEYGRRIVLSAITKLTTEAYEEHQIGTIEPRGLAGVTRTHTYTFDGSTETLDGFRRRLRRPGSSEARR